MSLRDQVLVAAEAYTKTKNPKMRWDEWNYFYSQITTQPGPAPEPFGFKRKADNPGSLDVDPMTVDFWWDRVRTLIAGGGGSGTGPSGADQPSPGSDGSGPGTGSASTNVFVDTLMMFLSVVFAGRMI